MLNDGKCSISCPLKHTVCHLLASLIKFKLSLLSSFSIFLSFDDQCPPVILRFGKYWDMCFINHYHYEINRTRRVCWIGELLNTDISDEYNLPSHEGPEGCLRAPRSYHRRFRVFRWMKESEKRDNTQTWFKTSVCKCYALSKYIKQGSKVHCDWESPGESPSFGMKQWMTSASGIIHSFFDQINLDFVSKITKHNWCFKATKI